jgi:hypothetical protein
MLLLRKEYHVVQTVFLSTCSRLLGSACRLSAQYKVADMVVDTLSLRAQKRAESALLSVEKIHTKHREQIDVNPRPWSSGIRFPPA